MLYLYKLEKVIYFKFLNGYIKLFIERWLYAVLDFIRILLIGSSNVIIDLVQK